MDPGMDPVIELPPDVLDVIDPDPRLCVLCPWTMLCVASSPGPCGTDGRLPDSAGVTPPAGTIAVDVLSAGPRAGLAKDEEASPVASAPPEPTPPDPCWPRAMATRFCRGKTFFTATAATTMHFERLALKVWCYLFQAECWIEG
jgi:hypothetical protein